MNSDPTKLKVAKQLDHAGVFFGIARLPNSSRVFAGCSDSKIYAVDMALERNPQAAETMARQAGARTWERSWNLWLTKAKQQMDRDAGR